MARTQARFLTRTWGDEDFKRLTRRAQGTYMFLISQANLSHAGLLPLTVKRWAQTADQCDVQQVEDDLALLAEREYVVIDENTEELLIRTLVRNDGVWKQPKVMLAMKADAAEIMSPYLRYRLRVELLKIDVSELEKEETRQAIQQVIEDTVNTLPDTPPEGYFSGGITAPEYPHACAGAPSSASTTTSATTATTAKGLATRDDPTNNLLIEHVRAYDEEPPLDAQRAVKTAIMRQVALGESPERIRAGLARMREKRVAVSLLPQLIAECSPVARPSTTDRAVATGIALVEKFRAEESA